MFDIYYNVRFASSYIALKSNTKNIIYKEILE